MLGHDEQDGTASYEMSRGYDDPVNKSRQARLKDRARVIEHTASRVALARIDRERRRLAAEEEWILNRPEEPVSTDGDGPIVYFRKAFGNAEIPEGKGYQYAAVRIEGMKRWYLTGPRAPRDGMAWFDLVEWAAKDELDLPTIWIATDWSAISHEPGLPN